MQKDRITVYYISKEKMAVSDVHTNRIIRIRAAASYATAAATNYNNMRTSS